MPFHRINGANGPEYLNFEVDKVADLLPRLGEKSTDTCNVRPNPEPTTIGAFPPRQCIISERKDMKI